MSEHLREADELIVLGLYRIYFIYSQAGFGFASLNQAAFWIPEDKDSS